MKNILDKATITEKANQLLAELRVNPMGLRDENNFKQGYLKVTGMGIIRYRNKTKII